MQSIFGCLFCGLFLSFFLEGERFDVFRVLDKKTRVQSGGFRREKKNWIPKIGFFARFIATAAVFGVQK